MFALGIDYLLMALAPSLGWLFLGRAIAGIAGATFATANPSTWTYYTMLKFGWTERDVGFSMGVVGLSIAIVQGVVIRAVIPRIGDRGAIYLGLFVMAAGYLGLTAIVAPVFLTQHFGYFTSEAAPIYFPGACFFAAAVLTAGSLGIVALALSGGRRDEAAVESGSA